MMGTSMTDSFVEFNDFEWDRLILAEREARFDLDIDIWKPLPMETEHQPGSLSGLYFHRKHQEKPCEDCSLFLKEYRAKGHAERKQFYRKRELPKHGTNGGYHRHRRLREELCEECRAWKNADQVLYRAKKKKEKNERAFGLY